jgi:thioredoxin 1
MPIDSVIHTNQHSVDRVLYTGLPVLLVFWRGDVPQSRELDPLLGQLAQRYAGRALIAKIDAQSEQELVRRFDVRLLPSIVAIRGGKTEALLSGRVPDRAIAAWLGHLADGAARPTTTDGPGVPVSTSAPVYANGVNGRAQAAATARPAPATVPQTLTDANFDRVTGAHGPVLVDFWAPWCGPCRMVAPSVDQLAAEFAGRAVVGKLNVDENPATARRFNIMGIPALYVFKSGQVVERISGAQPLHVLRAALARHVD